MQKCRVSGPVVVLGEVGGLPVVLAVVAVLLAVHVGVAGLAVALVAVAGLGVALHGGRMSTRSPSDCSASRQGAPTLL